MAKKKIILDGEEVAKDKNEIDLSLSLRQRLLKKTTVEESSILQDSKVFEPKDLIHTDVPMLNVALSGTVDGGLPPGILQIAGESRTFKSKFAIEIAKYFTRKFPDGMVLFYDSEFGMPESYFNELETENIIHTPIQNIEVLIHDITVQLNQVSDKNKDKMLIIVDSIGNLPSIKEVEDALAGKIVNDMTRAKRLKSLFRIVGTQIAAKNIYMVVINHTYKTMDMYPKDIVGGGTGSIYNSNIIWIISSSKEKDDKELTGFNFTIKIEKSRFVKQESRIPITVSLEEGIDKWSALMDLAIEGKFVTKPTAQKYLISGESDDSAVTMKNVDDDFYNRLLKTEFSQWIKESFQY